jgi:prepilin signal peptidase PulO-like enzyme (type II secretory pathway)
MIQGDAMTILYAFFFFLFGTLFGSFAFVVAERIPKHETLSGRSRCPHCGTPLRLYEVFPILGYLLNRGKCRTCSEKIPASYLWVELLSGALFAFSFLILGWTMDLGVALVMIVVLLTESLSDLLSQTVIDRVWIIGSVPVLVLRIFQGRIWPHLLSAALFFSFLFLIAWIGQRVWKKEALGGGDVKLFVFIGFCLTWPQALLALLLASFGGSIYGFIQKKKGIEPLPLVPFIFLGTLIAFFAGDAVITWYLRLLGA